MARIIKWRVFGRACGFWLGFSAFYLWLISKTQVEHLVAATLIGLATMLTLLALVSGAGLHFEFKLQWVVILLRRLPAKTLRDAGLLTVKLVRSIAGHRDPNGSLKQIPFAAGGEDPQSRARRALVLTGISVPPNTFAICVQPDRHSVLAHELIPRSGSPTEEEWPL